MAGLNHLLVLLPGKSHGCRSLVGRSPWGREESTRLSDFTFTFHFNALEKEMATHSSVLAWRIPGPGEPGGLPSLGSHRVGHDWSDLAAAPIFLRIRIFSNEPVFCFRWPKYYSFSFSPSNECSGLIGLTGLISLQSKGLSRVFSNTTIQKHQFFSAQLSL